MHVWKRYWNGNGDGLGVSRRSKEGVLCRDFRRARFGAVLRRAHGDVFDNDTAWDQASLHRHLGPHFEKQRPIVDGYPMPEV